MEERRNIGKVMDRKLKVRQEKLRGLGVVKGVREDERRVRERGFPEQQ